MMKEDRNVIRLKKPWPTKKVMEQIYAMKLWGVHTTPFYSGHGSHDNDLVEPYVNIISAFLDALNQPIVVCDLGCGDFNVGKDLVRFTKQYKAIDIVDDLVSYNKETFKDSNLEFICLDIVTDDLPSGDCVILRQVLQHLSNYEIECIVRKLYKFKYVIVTEHLPDNNFIPNSDIISGQGIRLKKKSGVNLLAPPFNLKVKSNRCLLRLKSKRNRGVIVTTLYEL